MLTIPFDAFLDDSTRYIHHPKTLLHHYHKKLKSQDKTHLHILKLLRLYNEYHHLQEQTASHKNKTSSYNKT